MFSRARARGVAGTLAFRIAAISAVILIVLTLAVVTSTALGARAAMSRQIDQQLARMLTVPVNASVQTLSEAAAGVDSAPPSGGPKHDRNRDHSDIGPRLPQRQPGAIQVVVSGNEVSSASYGDTTVAELNSQQLAQVLAIKTDQRPQTVDITGLGSYRMIARAQRGQDGPKTVYLGLSLRDVDAATWEVAKWASAVGALVAIGAVATMVWVVRRNLSPLGQVAATAAAVASADMVNSADVPAARVELHPKRDAAEVLQVGSALNTLLDRVAGALGARDAKEAQLRQFVADASHELRTPLAALKGYAQLGQRNGEPLAALAQIDQQAGLMTGLVEDLLTLARLEDGNEQPREIVDLHECALAVFSDAVVAYPDHEWEFAGLEGSRVRVVPGQLRRILQNLLANAAHHTPTGTRVQLQIEAAGEDSYRISVSDDGPGIAPQLREKVFDRFFCADASRTHASSGLGLALARQMAEANGGELALAVDGPLAGACFELELPASKNS